MPPRTSSSPYCGYRSPPPAGRVPASSEAQCQRQIRAYGRKVVRGRGDQGSDGVAVSLLRQRGGQGGGRGACGGKTPSSPYSSCFSQRRMYGLLPAIESASDVMSKTYVATQRRDHLPSVPASNHAYTDRALNLENAKTRGKPLLLVSVIWKDADEEVFLDPAERVGGVGFAFGVFDEPTRFNIIRVFTNEAYRGSKGVIFSILMNELVAGVKGRCKQLFPSSSSVLITIDNEAPCFRLRPGSSLLTHYESAGFTLHANPVEGNVEVRKEILIRREGEEMWEGGGERVLLQEKVFPPHVVSSILHEKVRGREGAGRARGENDFSLKDICEIASSTSDGKPSGNVIHLIGIESGGVTPRQGRLRWDVRLSDAWVQKMVTANDTFSACHSFVTREVRKMASECRNSKVEWHVMLVRPGCPDQDVHVDDHASSRRQRCYFTFLLPLTDNPNAGGTYFKTLNRTFSTVGGYALFHGNVEHAGLANRSEENRYFLYAVIFTGGDVN